MEKEFKITNKITDNLLKQMIQLDHSVYQEEDVGIFNICKEWLSINDKIYTVLLKENKVVGYINFMPVNEQFYEKIKQGKIKDSEITYKDIVKFNKRKKHKCLLTSIVIDKDYQSTLLIKLLFSGFLKHITSLNIEIDSIIMDCVSEMGEKCAVKFLNAKYITNSSSGKIYEGNIEYR